LLRKNPLGRKGGGILYNYIKKLKNTKKKLKNKRQKKFKNSKIKYCGNIWDLTISKDAVGALIAY
jgi:hypothetical protein